MSMGTKRKRIVKQRGVWQDCESCGQYLPCHPEIGLCGTCAFGEADAMMEFDGEWVAEIQDAGRR
ncbi:MAG TPA: hypothetical protein VFS33_10520 [Gemmatimonadales bacterium]|nr:hypothetical protein [Gemmatimonadales bacterium]